MTNEINITTVTLKDGCGRYVEHLKSIGKKPSTLGTTKRSLNLLIAEMGEAKEINKILPVHVDRFFKSESATMQPGKDGLKQRAEASILQIKRIVRSALVWWHEQGYSKRIPIPASEKKFIKLKSGKQNVSEKAKPKPDKAETKGIQSNPLKITSETQEESGEGTGKDVSKKINSGADTEARDTTVEPSSTWKGFDNGDEEQKAAKGETVATMRFNGNEE